MGIIALFAIFPLLAAAGALQLVADPEPQQVFSGPDRVVRMTWHNSGGTPVALDIRARLYLASSSTAVSIKDAPWKRLDVLPGQTVLETAQMDFPEVRAKTPFVIQWITEDGTILGTTQVQVYPTNLLSALPSLLANEPVGILDPQNQIEPLFQEAGVEFMDLSDNGPGAFAGKLAIVISPPTANASADFGQDASGDDASAQFTAMAGKLKAMAEKGRAVVWIQPARPGAGKLQPSFFTLRAGRGTIVIVQSDLVGNLSENPRHQLNLIQLCHMALHPEIQGRLPLSF